LVNLSGQQFGLLKALSRCTKGDHGYYHCVCNCGNRIDVRSDSLVAGKKTSCGCNESAQVKIGQVFGFLAVRRFLRVTNTRQVRWKCECACGKMVVAQTFDLIAGKMKSCKCRGVSVESKCMVRAMSVLPTSAAHRGLGFSLTEHEVKKLIFGDCYYCGATPEEGQAFKRKKYKTKKMYPMNGIDRLNSDVGYVSGNCVSACSVCNIAKSTLTVDEFLGWTRRVVHHQIQKGQLARAS